MLRSILAFTVASLTFISPLAANPSETMVYGPHQMMTFDAKSPKGQHGLQRRGDSTGQ